MKNRNLLIGIGIVVLIIIIILIKSLGSKNPEIVGKDVTSTSTISMDQALNSSSSPLKVTDYKVSQGPVLKSYINNEFGFSLKYPSDFMIVAASEKTPLLYRSDREFAYCVPELKTAIGACTPVLTLAPVNGSGHGVSVYVLDDIQVAAKYPEKLPNVRIHEMTHRRYEVYYSDTTSTNSTKAENIARQELMATMVTSFMFTK